MYSLGFSESTSKDFTENGSRPTKDSLKNLLLKLEIAENSPTLEQCYADLLEKRTGLTIVTMEDGHLGALSENDEIPQPVLAMWRTSAYEQLFMSVDESCIN